MNYSIYQNSTQKPECVPTWPVSNPFSIILNIIRATVALLYLISFLLLIKIKQFHDKRLAFLHNLNAIGLFYFGQAISVIFTTTCSNYTDAYCAFQAICVLLGTPLSGYGLTALAIFRLTCVYLLNLEKKLTGKVVFISLFSIWFIAIVISAIQILAVETRFYFVSSIPVCLFDSSKQFHSFTFFAITNVVIPNVGVIAIYLATLFKLKRINRALSASSKSKPRPVRITVQLIVYIIMFEFNCLANLAVFYQIILLGPFLPEDLMTLMRIIKGIMSFHWISFHGIQIHRLFFHSLPVSWETDFIGDVFSY